MKGSLFFGIFQEFCKSGFTSWLQMKKFLSPPFADSLSIW